MGRPWNVWKNASVALLDKLYTDTVKAEHIGPDQLAKVVESYAATTASLDAKVAELENRSRELLEQIDDEKMKLAGPTGKNAEKLGKQVGVGIFAEVPGEVEIVLKYGKISYFR